MKKAIIFDLYDTLLQIEVKANPYIYLLNHFVSDGEITSKELISHIMTSDEAAVKSIANLQDVGLIDENFDNSLFLKYLDLEVESTAVIAGTFKTLDKLKDKYRLFVLSNLATSYKYPYYKFHLEKWIEKAFFSCECDDKKPNPSFFQKVVDFSGLKKEDFIMIGDNPISDVKASINFGIEARLKDKELEEIVKDLI
jgi:putative hydrolase of the HAD superfamily